MEDTLSGSYEPGQYAKYGEEPASNSTARGNQSEYDEYPWTRAYNDEYGAWYFYNELISFMFLFLISNFLIFSKYSS